VIIDNENAQKCILYILYEKATKEALPECINHAEERLKRRQTCVQSWLATKRRSQELFLAVFTFFPVTANPAGGTNLASCEIRTDA